VYRQAEWGARGEVVAATFGVALNTARNLISEARRRGFLEPSPTNENEPEGDNET
jgi:predicted DNA-binding WGR domain protein